MMLNSIRQHTQDSDERQLLADAMDKLEESLSKQRHLLEDVQSRNCMQLLKCHRSQGNAIATLGL